MDDHQQDGAAGANEDPSLPASDYPGGQGWDVGDMGAPAPPEPRRPRIGTLLRVGFLVLIAGGALFGWLASANRDREGAITRGGELAAAELRVGDCFDHPGAGEMVDVVRAVPCDDSHDLEVFHEFEHREGDAPPSQDAAVERIAAECLPAFATFVGVAYESSELDIFTFEPTVESWEEGDRTVTCAVYEMDGSKLTGTARGAQR